MTIFDADDLVIAEKTTFARFYFSCAAFLREFRIIPAGFAPDLFSPGGNGVTLILATERDKIARLRRRGYSYV